MSLQPRRAAGPGVPALFTPGTLDHQLVTRKGVRQIPRRMLGIFHNYPEADSWINMERIRSNVK